MKFVKIETEMFKELKSLQTDYKVAIGEDVPSGTELENLKKAIEQGHIHFYGCSLFLNMREQSAPSSFN